MGWPKPPPVVVWGWFRPPPQLHGGGLGTKGVADGAKGVAETTPSCTPSTLFFVLSFPFFPFLFFFSSSYCVRPLFFLLFLSSFFLSFSFTEPFNSQAHSDFVLQVLIDWQHGSAIGLWLQWVGEGQCCRSGAPAIRSHAAPAIWS